jgi:uncharacterized protein YjcR
MKQPADFTQEQIREIMREYRQGMRLREIMEKYNLSRKNASKIANGYYWKPDGLGDKRHEST